MCVSRPLCTCTLLLLPTHDEDPAHEVAAVITRPRFILLPLILMDPLLVDGIQTKGVLRVETKEESLHSNSKGY